MFDNWSGLQSWPISDLGTGPGMPTIPLPGGRIETISLNGSGLWGAVDGRGPPQPTISSDVSPIIQHFAS